MMTGIPWAVTAATGSPSASVIVGARTIAAGFCAAALSRIPIWAAASSLGDPSSSTLTPRSAAAFSAPLNTHCQYSDVVALTITGIVSSAIAIDAAVRPSAATDARSTDFFSMVFPPCSASQAVVAVSE